jgi:hypothetical protein
MPRLFALCLFCGLALLACSKSSQPSLPAVSTDGTPTGMQGSDDAGAVHTPGDDAGSDDGGSGTYTTSECVSVDPGSYTNEDILPDQRGSGVTTPADLVVTRAIATWQGACPDPTLVVKLSGGGCPSGDGHELQLLFSAKALKDGTVSQGQNNVLPEPNSQGIRVRYTRPKTLTPSGVWGSCDGALGQVVFPDVVKVATHGPFKARVQLDLGSCDGSKQTNQTVTGWFNVELHRGLNDVCPP